MTDRLKANQLFPCLADEPEFQMNVEVVGDLFSNGLWGGVLTELGLRNVKRKERKKRQFYFCILIFGRGG